MKTVHACVGLILFAVVNASIFVSHMLGEEEEGEEGLQGTQWVVTMVMWVW